MALYVQHSYSPTAGSFLQRSDITTELDNSIFDLLDSPCTSNSNGTTPHGHNYSTTFASPLSKSQVNLHDRHMELS